ncbi:hypothetical protein ACFPK9_01080 [Rubritalea spongiae]|uniref:Integrase catalytic domain-containing protein n=1 Tax=Rubritalea spongiae TaxID=430797 RepID=A0ABW5DZ92_9BACT
MFLTTPEPNSPDFAQLTMEQRDGVRAWLRAFESHPITKPITQWFATVARSVGVTPSTVKTKYYAIKKTNDWRCLIDSRKSAHTPTTCRTKNPEFQQFWKLLCERNQRSTKAAYRHLIRMWRNKEEIPGYTDLPDWPSLPQGWSYRNLNRISPNKLELTAMRHGIKAAAKYMPMVYSTRVGLWPGAFYQFDDVWHDNYVRCGSELTRVIELGALDVLSGCRFAYAAKPRLRKDGGKGKQNITEAEARLFVAGVLWDHGINHQLGTTLVLENGTMTVSGEVARIIEDYGTRPDGSPLIQLSFSGISGKQQAVLGHYAGRGGGNPRHKASLESLHNLIHNELGMLIGQTGHDRNEPEMTHGITREQEQLLKVIKNLPAERAALLKHPVIDFHSQFLPLLNDLYADAINGRTDHNLEGWHKCGFVQTEYTLMPGSEQWLQLEQIPDETFGLISSAARQEPEKWTRTRKLSPAEVWESGLDQIQPVKPYLICDILGKDLAKKRKITSSYITFTDSAVDAEPLNYSTRIRTTEGNFQELEHGKEYQVYANPFAPDQLFICDMNFRCLGIAPRQQRVCSADTTALQASFGKAAERKAQLLTSLRNRHAPDAQEIQERREHNRRVANGELVTAHERRSEGGRIGSNTRRANALDEHEVHETFSAISERTETPAPMASDDDISLSDLT